MEVKEINNIIPVELYRFISQYYDPATADYVMGVMGLQKADLAGIDLSYETFCNILQYLHKMSGDKQICYNAGRFFQKNRLFSNLTIPSVRFSLKVAFYKIADILKEFFPGLNFSIRFIHTKSFILEVDTNNPPGTRDYFFSEFLRGIISSLPNYWNIPSAEVKVQSYSFSIEEILDLLDLPYKKEHNTYSIYDQVVALEKETQGKGDGKNLESTTIQVVPDDLYIKDIFIRKNTILNSASLSMRVRWEYINLKKLFIPPGLFLVGLILFFYFLAQKTFPEPLLISFFLLYGTVLALIYTLFKSRSLKKLYWKIEDSLSKELSQQKNAIDNAIHSAFTRMRSIENLTEITKRIIYEKDISTLVDNIRKLTARALNADRATVFIHDREKKELYAGAGLSEEKKEIRFPEDAGIAGQVFKLRKIVNVRDAYNNPLFNKDVDKKTGFKTDTMLGAPLLDLEKNIIGVIQVLNKRDGQFESLDEQVLETLSTYIAIALKDTLTIRQLERRGIDPEMLEGLSSIIKYLFDRYNTVKNTFTKMEIPEAGAISPMIEDIYTILDKLQFLFAEDYQVKKEAVSINDIADIFTSYISENKGASEIQYENLVSVPKEIQFLLDKELLKKAAFPILENSLESLGQGGVIKTVIYNYIDLPTSIAHNFSLIDILSDYNAYGEENSARFIDFLKSRKPLLESDLKRIEDSIKEYIAFVFFDSGSSIDQEIKVKIFNPFFSAKKRFGLGLAISKTAVKRMGGRIEEPEGEGQGNRIRMLIPKITG